MNAHAKLSPSSAHRWVPCPGSVVMEEGRPDVETEEQAEGTALHQLAAHGLRTGSESLGFIREDEKTAFWATDEQREAVRTYVDAVRQYAEGGELFVEHRVPIGHVTGEEGAEGTADAIVILPGELQVHDAKFGRVRVEVERNPQTMLYALGALDAFELTHGPFDRVRLVIHQPRLGPATEWTCSVGELRSFAERVKVRADIAGDAAETYSVTPPDGWYESYLAPGETQCHYCKAKAVCPALAAKVEAELGMPLADAAATDPVRGAVAGTTTPTLATTLKAVPLIERWCEAVREEAARLLNEGKPVPGFKLVQGRQGNRKWSDPTQAETMLRKTFRLAKDEAYTYSVISPTEAERRCKEWTDHEGEKRAPAIQPKQWQKLQQLVTRAPAALVVAPESDKRPAVSVVAPEEFFTDETSPVAGLV